MGYEEQIEKESNVWFSLPTFTPILEHLCESPGRRMKLRRRYNQVVQQASSKEVKGNMYFSQVKRHS